MFFYASTSGGPGLCVWWGGMELKTEPDKLGFLRPPLGLADVSVVYHKTLLD